MLPVLWVYTHCRTQLDQKQHGVLFGVGDALHHSSQCGTSFVLLLAVTCVPFCIAGALMDVLFFTPDGAYRDNTTGPLPALPVPVNYPSSGAITLMDLVGPEYKPTVSACLCFVFFSYVAIFFSCLPSKLA